MAWPGGCGSWRAAKSSGRHPICAFLSLVVLRFMCPSRGWMVYRLECLLLKSQSHWCCVYGEVREWRCIMMEELLGSVIDIHPWLRVAGVVGGIARLVSFVA